MGLKPTRPRQSKATVKEPRLFDGFLLASSPQSSDLATSLATFDEGFGQRPLCGLDEAGRGPLAGPLVAAAVILNPDEPWPGVNDSKKLTAPQREELFEKIVAEALDFSVALKSPQDVDRLNPLAASLEAMAEAYAALSLKPALALVDGPFKPNLAGDSRAIPHGDSLSLAIAAASIVAKVTRDRLMLKADADYPEYGFARHKGYGVKEHLAALAKYGPCPLHRLTYRGVLSPKAPTGDKKTGLFDG